MRTSRSIASVGLASVALAALVAAPARATPSPDGAPDRIGGKFILTNSIPGKPAFHGVFRMAVSGMQGEHSLAWARAHASDTTFPSVGTAGPIVVDGTCLSARSLDLVPCYSPDPAQRFVLRETDDGLQVTQAAAGAERTRVLGWDDHFKQWNLTETPSTSTTTTLLGSELARTDATIPDDVVLPPIGQAIWDEIVRAEDGFSVEVRSERSSRVEAFDRQDRVASAAPVADRPGVYLLELPSSTAGKRLDIITTAENGQTSTTSMNVPGAVESDVPRPDITWITETPAGDFRVRGFAPTGAIVMADLAGVAGTALASGRASFGMFELTIPGRHAGADIEYRNSVGTGMSAPRTLPLTPTGEGHLPIAAEPPRVSGIVHYAGDTLFVEGTVAYDPRQWAVTRVSAFDAGGRPLASEIDYRGAFALPVPTAMEGQRITLVTTIGDVESKPAEVVLARGENTAADSFPLTVTSPAKDTVVGTRPTFTGAGIPGSTVTISTGETTAPCTTTTGVDGAWSCTPDTDLATGPQRATITENAFWASVTPSNRTADFVVQDGSDEVAPVTVGAPAKGAVVTTRRPVFSGTGQDGATVEIRGSSRIVATTTVTEGRWSVASTLDLVDGGYGLGVTQTTATGGTSTTVAAFTVRARDAVTPVVVTAPTAGSTVAERTPVFTGTGHSGATVTIRGSVQVIGSATVRDGAWTITSSIGLVNGSYDLYVDQTSGGVTTTTRHAFRVQSAVTAPIVVTHPANGSEVASLRPVFTGTATPNAEIEIGSSRRVVATATANVKGDWSAPTLEDLAAGGKYRLTATQTKAGSTTTAPVEFSVARTATR